MSIHTEIPRCRICFLGGTGKSSAVSAWSDDTDSCQGCSNHLCSDLNAGHLKGTVHSIRPTRLGQLFREIFCILKSEDAEVEQEELIAPCNCRGTIKYVHRGCLNQWRIACIRSCMDGPSFEEQLALLAANGSFIDTGHNGSLLNEPLTPSRRQTTGTAADGHIDTDDTGSDSPVPSTSTTIRAVDNTFRRNPDNYNERTELTTNSIQSTSQAQATVLRARTSPNMANSAAFRAEPTASQHDETKSDGFNQCAQCLAHYKFKPSIIAKTLGNNRCRLVIILGAMLLEMMMVTIISLLVHETIHTMSSKCLWTCFTSDRISISLDSNSNMCSELLVIQPTASYTPVSLLYVIYMLLFQQDVIVAWMMNWVPKITTIFVLISAAHWYFIESNSFVSVLLLLAWWRVFGFSVCLMLERVTLFIGISLAFSRHFAFLSKRIKLLLLRAASMNVLDLEEE